MLSFKKSYVLTGLAHELQYNLNSKKADYKKRTEENIEGIEAFYIVADNTGINDYKELIFSSEHDSILLLTYAEYEEITSKKSLDKIIRTKVVYDLRRS